MLFSAAWAVTRVTLFSRTPPPSAGGHSCPHRYFGLKVAAADSEETHRSEGNLSLVNYINRHTVPRKSSRSGGRVINNNFRPLLIPPLLPHQQPVVFCYQRGRDQAAVRGRRWWRSLDLLSACCAECLGLSNVTALRLGRLKSAVHPDRSRSSNDRAHQIETIACSFI